MEPFEIISYQGKVGITAHELQQVLKFMTIDQMKDAIETFNLGVKCRRTTGDDSYSLLTDKTIAELKAGTTVDKLLPEGSIPITIAEDTYFIEYADTTPLLHGLMTYETGTLRLKKMGAEVVRTIEIFNLLSEFLLAMQQ